MICNNFKNLLDFDPRFGSAGSFQNFKKILLKNLYIVYKFGHIYPKPRIKPYQTKKNRIELNFIDNRVNSIYLEPKKLKLKNLNQMST